MPQFDVYPSPRATRLIPFVVDLQSDLMSGLPTRLVAPLGLPEIVDRHLIASLTPQFEIGRTLVVMLTPEIAAVPARTLRSPVANLQDRRYEILRAIDALLSGV